MTKTVSAAELSFEIGRSIPLPQGAKLFEKALKEHHILNVWNKHREHIVPYSLFFSLLGDIDNVLLGSKKEKFKL
ncbi:MAG: hypothetical protein WED04_04730 [Promethearchaeati archaeon SRVP18_Atabeyarchaeia-1]